MVLLTLASFIVPTIQSVKESYETTLLRRQKDREEQAKMEKEMEQKQELEKKNEHEKRLVETARSGGTVAKPGFGARKKRFMPKRRGRIGL